MGTFGDNMSHSLGINIIVYSSCHLNGVNNINSSQGNLGNKAMHILNGNIHRSRKLPRRRGLRFGWWNCGNGFLTQGKKEELESFLETNKIDIFGVQEVEIHKTAFFYDKLYAIRGYKHIFPLSLEKHGIARCMVYYREHMEDMIRLREDLMSPTQPVIWLQLCPKKGLMLAFMYREWTGINGENSVASQRLRLHELLEAAKKASESGSEVWWMGDMNANAEDVKLGNSADPVANMINNFVVEEGFEQLMRRTTRLNQELGESILDHLYTNTPERAMMIKIHETSSSEHAMVTFRRARRPRNDYRASFLKELGYVNWKKRFEVNSMYPCNEFVLQAFDTQAPLVSFMYTPVIPESTKMVMKEMNLTHTSAKFTNTVEEILDLNLDTTDREGKSVEELAR